MMLIYISPQGGKYLYPEGEQPEGYVLCDVQAKGYEPKKAAAKRRTPANKKAKADDK